jgi:hypothetical protein
MVICPIAIAVGCKKCPAFAVCPVKTVIGDYKPDAHPDAPARAKPGKAPAAAKSKPASNRKGARARRPRK